MKRVVSIAILALFLLPIVYAQLDWSITDLRCGNGVLDEFELCEKGLEEGFCDELGDVLEIDAVCDPYHCTCLPRVNKAFCENNIREGVELCDGDSEDRCPAFGNAINLSLTCNKKTCGCDLNETLPVDYNPLVVEELSNASQTASKCGDKKVERNEDCDPPNTLCTTAGDEAGICTDKCKCVEPSMLGKEEEPVKEEVKEENVSVVVEENVSESVELNVTEVPEKKPGFFARLWAWFAGLFS